MATAHSPLSESEVLEYLDDVIARLERLGDRLEAYLGPADTPVPQEGPDEHPPPSA